METAIPPLTSAQVDEFRVAVAHLVSEANVAKALVGHPAFHRVIEAARPGATRYIPTPGVVTRIIESSSSEVDRDVARLLKQSDWWHLQNDVWTNPHGIQVQAAMVRVVKHKGKEIYPPLFLAAYSLKNERHTGKVLGKNLFDVSHAIGGQSNKRAARPRHSWSFSELLLLLLLLLLPLLLLPLLFLVALAFK